MKTFRIIMSVHVVHPGGKRTHQMPTFYVHGEHPEHARLVAVDIAFSMHSGVVDGSCTSGSAIQVDNHLDPVGASDKEYLSWNQ